MRANAGGFTSSTSGEVGRCVGVPSARGGRWIELLLERRLCTRWMVSWGWVRHGWRRLGEILPCRYRHVHNSQAVRHALVAAGVRVGSLAGWWMGRRPPLDPPDCRDHRYVLDVAARSSRA